MCCPEDPCAKCNQCKAKANAESEPKSGTMNNGYAVDKQMLYECGSWKLPSLLTESE